MLVLSERTRGREPCACEQLKGSYVLAMNWVFFAELTTGITSRPHNVPLACVERVRRTAAAAFGQRSTAADFSPDEILAFSFARVNI